MRIAQGAAGRLPRFASSKFAPPKLASWFIPRPRLLEALDAGAGRQLTVVGASPGAGKTTLVVDWLATRPAGSVAWLGCDAADSDPVRFTSALVMAMRHGFGDRDLGESALQLLAVDGHVSMDVVAALVDDLEDHPDPCVLVIDDLHLATGADDPVAAFLEARPRTLQVVVASRSEPALRLPRMRTLDDLVELRDPDLAFTVEETQGFLSAFGVDITASDAEVVNERTRGWPTGVQLMAIALRSTQGGTASLDRLDLAAEGIAGYFVEEVLSRQPTEITDFMLATSLLDELTVPACTAMVGDRAATILHQVSSSHLFVSATDGSGPTYRYHPLIKAVLQDELRVRHPRREPALHTAAARHFEAEGRVVVAARHLLAAGELTAASELLGRNLVQDVLGNPSTSSELDLEELRPELFAGNAEMLVPLASELLWRGAFEAGARAVALARRCRVDVDQQPELAVRMALVDTQLHAAVGELDDALQRREAVAEAARTASGVDDWLAFLDSLAMYCDVYLGRYGQARDMARRLVASSTSATLTEVLCPGVISQAASLEGALDEAATLAARSLDAARRLRFDEHFFAFHAMRTTAQLALERRDLAAAAETVEHALDIVSGARPGNSFLAQLDRARIWAAQGEPEPALASLEPARVSLRSERSAFLAEADELEARLRVAVGDRAGAVRAARRLRGSRRTVVDAILALAAGDVGSAERALGGTPAVGPTTRADVELQLLRANLRLIRDDADAPRAVRQALASAQRHGFVQTVLDTAPGLVDHVLADPGLYPAGLGTSPVALALLATRRPDGRGTTLVDPLTDAELRVLGLLAEHLTYADIAAELHLSLNTVKTHLRHAYVKLDVSSRSSAIARATTLGLLDVT